MMSSKQHDRSARESRVQIAVRFGEYEPHMRAALQLALEHQSLEAAGLLEEEPFRRGQRQEILRTTIAPLRPKL